MKFNLSTLLLLVTSFACAIGWFSEAKRSQRAKAAWQTRETELNENFSKMALAVSFGSEAIASAQAANDILSRLEPLVPINNNDPFDFDTDRDFVDQTAISVVLNLWQNEKVIQDSMFAVIPAGYHLQIPNDLAMKLAKPQIELLRVKNTLELIDRALELFVELPFPIDQKNKIDTNSSEFKSFDEFITLAKNAG